MLGRLDDPPWPAFAAISLSSRCGADSERPALPIGPGRLTGARAGTPSDLRPTTGTRGGRAHDNAMKGSVRMIRLAMLLVGGAPFRRYWWLLPVAGALWMALGAFLIVDATDGELRFTAELLGAVLAIEGVLSLCGALVGPAPLRAALRWRAAALLLLGAAIILPLDFGDTVPDRIVFGTAFLVDGALRIASAWVVRFEGWRPALAFGATQVLVGFMVAGNW